MGIIQQMLCKDAMNDQEWRWRLAADMVPVAVQRLDIKSLVEARQLKDELVAGERFGHPGDDRRVLGIQGVKIVVRHGATPD
jgi:hypothetical protein